MQQGAVNRQYIIETMFVFLKTIPSIQAPTATKLIKSDIAALDLIVSTFRKVMFSKW